MEAQPARGRHIARHTKVNLDCLYEMVVRNGFFVPSKKCSFVTVNYLCSVKAKVYHVPAYKDVRLRPCPSAPKKQLLVDTVIAIGQQRGVDFGLKADGPHPNTSWLLAVVSTYKPEHAYFGKGYKPTRAKADRLLDNDDGFFDGLPPALTQSKNVKRSGVVKKLLQALPDGLVLPRPVRPAPRRAPSPVEEEKSEEPAEEPHRSPGAAGQQNADMLASPGDLQRGRLSAGGFSASNKSGLTPAMKDMGMASPPGGGKRTFDEFQGSAGMGSAQYDQEYGQKRQRGPQESGIAAPSRFAPALGGSITPFPGAQYGKVSGNPAPNLFRPQTQWQQQSARVAARGGSGPQPAESDVESRQQAYESEMRAAGEGAESSYEDPML